MKSEEVEGKNDGVNEKQENNMLTLVALMSAVCVLLVMALDKIMTSIVDATKKCKKPKPKKRGKGK